ncbi:MAG: hypothetical protein SOZ51_10655 [Eubacteriales bacterium]|nr:hypothetical protein [Eubacteriales bacterium]
MKRKQKIAAVVLCVATAAALGIGIAVCLPKPISNRPSRTGEPSDITAPNIPKIEPIDLPPLDADDNGLIFDIEQQTRESGAKVLPDEGRGSR